MFLLDTNLVSELRKVQIGKANPGVAAWAGQVDVRDLNISVITLEESKFASCSRSVMIPPRGRGLPSLDEPSSTAGLL